MGFRDQLLRILEYLPNEDRQTLLFSATQTRDVSNIAALSLKKPEYLGVYDKEKTSTPDSLQQSYVVLPLEHKLNAVYSFVKSHLKCKSIIFLASCAQVRHAWELFCSLQPGVPVMALHGKIVQQKRTKIYFDFLQRPHAVLFATDIAARGLDFPGVDWVVQVDAPEDRDMYIHRAGRTARYRAGGKSLLLLTPSEEKKGFVQLLQGKKGKSLPIKKLTINPSKTAIVTQRAASMVAADVKLHHLAKKAYKSYVRSIFLMPNKDIFDVKDLTLDEFSASLGLASTPSLRFLNTESTDRAKNREKKNVNHKLQKLKQQIKLEKLTKKLRKLGKSDAEIEAAASLSLKKDRGDGDKNGDNDDDEADDDVLVSKPQQKWKADAAEIDDPSLDSDCLEAVPSSRHPKKIRVDGTNAPNKRIRFDEDGNEVDVDRSIHVGDDVAKTEVLTEGLESATDEYVQRVRQRLRQNYEQDRSEEKDRVRAKHKKRRLQEKAAVADEERGAAAAVTLLAPPQLGDDDAAADGDDSASSSASSSGGDEDGNDSDTTASNDIMAHEELALSLIRGRS